MLIREIYHAIVPRPRQPPHVAAGAMARDLRLLARGVALGKTHLTEQGVSMIQGLLARGLMLGLAAVALCISGGAFAQGGKITVGLDGTFAPHAMPKLGGGIEGFNV